MDIVKQLQTEIVRLDGKLIINDTEARLLLEARAVLVGLQNSIIEERMKASGFTHD